MGVNDSIFSGNEQQKLYIAAVFLFDEAFVYRCIPFDG